MRRKPRQLSLSCLLAPLFGILLTSAAAFAQEQEQPVTGSIELGGQQLWGKVTGRLDLPFRPGLSKSKLNEYRDFTDAFTLKRADVTILLGKHDFVHVQAQSGFTRSGFLNDQAYLVTFERPGKYLLQFRWDETPHIFSNTTQFIASESSPGVFTLDPSLRSDLIAVRTNPALIGSLFDSLLAGVSPFDLSLHRDTVALGAAVTPTPDWALGFQFSREKQDGYRPIGTYSPGFELPEPIDYRTTRIQANAEYSKQKGGFQVGYLGSIFENKVDTLVWELPFENVDAFFRTSRGRFDLYPDNTAHNLSFAGAFNITDSTRFMASVVPGWMRQNDPFVPFTINPALAVLDLPAQSLNGSKQTLAMNYTLVSFPVKHLEITARYRSYDHNNDTPSLLFPTYVILDIAPTNFLGPVGEMGRLNRQSVPYEFNRKNVELAATWEFVRKNTLKVGYEFERYDREHRDVSQSDEHAFVTSLDLNPNKLTLVRFSYRHSNRNPNLYVENTDSFASGPGAFRQLEEFRRFDEAARVRDRVEATVQFSPLKSFTVSGSYGTTQDDYDESLYGLLKDISRYYTFDFDYSPRPEVTLFGEYTREKYSTRLRTRVLCALGPGLCAGDNNSPNNDWESSTRNHIDTWTGGVDVFFNKGNVTLSSFYSLSAAYGSMRATALGDSSLPGFLLDSSLTDCAFGGCTPENYPDTKNRLHNLVVSVKFDLIRRISPKLEYRYERYDRGDWQSQLMRPYMFAVDPDSNQQVFLGADTPSYRAHVLFFGVEYRF